MTSSSRIRVLIVDDHEIYRDGLRLMLGKEKNIELIGEAENGTRAIQLAETLRPDVIIMDIVMPLTDGIAATRKLADSVPAANVIALSMFNDENLIVDMLEAGAKGYLLKNAAKSEILEAIDSVNRNLPFYCSNTTRKLARLLAKSHMNPFTRAERISFTDRELQIMELICQELTNKEIAERLFLSSRTVEGYRVRILEKIHAKGAAGIVIYALTHGIFQPDGSHTGGGYYLPHAGK